MRISFICNPVYTYGTDGWSPNSVRLGGSEEFIVETAKRLSRAKHDVAVYHNGKHGNYDGVNYQSYHAFRPGDITINVNYPEFENAGPTIFWSSLTQNHDLSRFEAVCYISEYARDNTGLEHKNLFWVPPGYNPRKVNPGTKMPKQCFYSSSPDRGLDTLLEVWPKVVAKHPEATLIITYGVLDVDLPGVICLGEADEDTMNEIYQTSDVWCHPASGGELYCMTGIKAQAAGCVPVVFPTMALAETVRHGVHTLPGTEMYASSLIGTLDLPEYRQEIRDKLATEHYPTWEDSVKMLLEVIEKVKQNEQRTTQKSTSTQGFLGS